MTRKNPIDEYLSGVQEEQRVALEGVRRTVAMAAPEATEGMSYGMPAFRYYGRPLIGFAAFKNHCSLFPMSDGVLDQLGDELAAFRTAKGTLHFTPDKLIPRLLIKKVLTARMKEIEAKNM